MKQLFWDKGKSINFQNYFMEKDFENYKSLSLIYKKSL